MIAIAVIALTAVVCAVLGFARLQQRAQRQRDEPVDPVKVEREVYQQLYGARSAALETAPAPPAKATRKRAPRSTRELDAKRLTAGRAIQ